MLNTKQQKLVKKSESEAKEANSNFTCEICVEPVSASNKFISNGVCRHDFCSDCIAKYIEAKVLEFNITNIGCPALDCDSSLDPLSCRPILANHLFDKWCDLLCNATVLQCYARRYVYCPYRDCSALILNECEDNAKKCNCPNCKREFCFKCKSQWHAGYRCSEKGKYRDENDILAGKLIEKNKWTRCPDCRHAVERRGGCILVHCRCGLTFCHACGKANKDGLRNCCRKMVLDKAMLIFFCFVVIIIAWSTFYFL